MVLFPKNTPEKLAACLREKYLFDFTCSNEDELSVCSGQLVEFIMLLPMQNGGWSVPMRSSDLAPKSYLEKAAEITKLKEKLKISGQSACNLIPHSTSESTSGNNLSTGESSTNSLFKDSFLITNDEYPFLK